MNSCFEAIEVNRFGQVFDKAGFATLASIFLAAEAAEGDALDLAARPRLAHEVMAVAVGEFDIGEQQIEGGLGFFKSGARRRDSVGGYDVVAALPENGGEVSQGVGIVFDHEDPQVRPAYRHLR